jgi:SDR family mycofactocin-dependent oxidoreductase
MGKLDGKVAFITGAARGQGRSHAIRLAEEGADIIAVDIAAQIETVKYPMSTPADLEETQKEIEALDRRIVTRVADVRDPRALQAAFDEGVAELGRVDIVLANAGIAPQGAPERDVFETWADVVAVNMTGVFATVHVAAPTMIAQGTGGAIVLTSSTQGISGRGGDGSGAVTGYAASKHGVVGLMHSFAHWLAPYNIRVNTVHPTGVATPMVENEVLGRWIEENPGAMDQTRNLLDVGLVEARDISNAVLFLVSDEGRYVTGTALPVDAGFLVR